MPDQDRRSDAETAAKRPTYHYYLDIRNDGKGVGPHTPSSINWWLEHRMISPEILARRIDQDKWTRLSEITRFSNFLNKIAKLLFHGDEVMLFGVGMIPSTGSASDRKPRGGKRVIRICLSAP